MTELADINSLEVLFSKNNLIFGNISDISQFSVQNVISGGDTTITFIDQSSFFFDGVDDNLQSQTSFTSLDGQGYVGISLWIKIPNVASANENIIKINNSVSGYSFLAFVRTTGIIDASCVSGSSYTRSNTGAITDNTWHHVFFRLDFSLGRYDKLRIFVDGVLNHSGSNFSSLGSFPNNSSTMLIATNGSTAYSNVYVNELAFYTSGDDTLPNQIYNNGTANDLNTANNYEPLVWYRSEDGTWNGREWEISDKNQNGVNLLSFNLTESSRVGDFPFAETSSFFYDGVDEYLKGNNDYEVLNGIETLSFSLWIKPTDSGVTRVLLSIGTANADTRASQFQIFRNANNGIQFYIASLSYGGRTNDNVVIQDEWNHILVTRDDSQSAGNKLKFYVNGVDESLTDGTRFAPSSDSNSALFIGEHQNGFNSAFLGGIDEVAIWSGEDLRADYLTIYNQGLPVNLNNLSGISQPTNWWRSETATYPQYSTLSFNFDGVDDFVSMGNVLNFADDGSDPFSISFWIKSTSGSGVQRFVSKITGSSDGYGIYQNGNIIYMLIGSYINNCLFNNYNFVSLNNNTWHHLVWTYDGSQDASGMKLHINGGTNVLTGGVTNLPINSVSTTQIFSIGANGQLGKMDEVSIFNYALTQENVTSIYNGGTPNDLSSLTPLGWWRMGEGAVFDGTNWTLNDFGTGRNNGTSANMVEANRQTDFPVNNNGQFTMPSFNNAYDVLSQNMVEGSQSSNVPNFNNKSFTFDGVDDYNDCGNTSNLNFERTDAFSISVWFKKPNLAGAQFIIGKNQNAPSRSGYFAFTSANLVKFRITQSNGNNIEIRHNIAHNLNVWEHYVFTYDGSSSVNGLNMYQNGTLLTNVTRTGANLTQTTQTSVPFTIGAREGLGLFFNGEIDESSVFISELNASQVTEIYNQGVPNDISSLNPISWWRMGENASWNGTNWTLNDLGSGSNNATSVNMVLASRTFDVPT